MKPELLSEGLSNQCRTFFQNKEIAANVRQIPEGSVIFEDVGIEKMCGQVTKTLQMSTEDIAHSNEPLFGRIVYQTVSGWVHLDYGAVINLRILINFGDQLFIHK